MKGFKGAQMKYPLSHHAFFGGFPSRYKPLVYKGKTVEEIAVRIKCPFCDNLINTKFDLKECGCIFNPKIQKYEVTHSVRCYKCSNEVKNVTITLSRKQGWSVS